MPAADARAMIRDRMKRAARTEVGREAPMVITPRRLARLLAEIVRLVRGDAFPRSTSD